jgi:maltose-binding protein MalE
MESVPGIYDAVDVVCKLHNSKRNFLKNGYILEINKYMNEKLEENSEDKSIENRTWFNEHGGFYFCVKQ